MNSALEGIFVLDFGTAIAGAFTSALLGDMGAEIVKVEPRAGDFARQWPPFYGGESQLFLAWNKNKKSLVLDLTRPEGQRVARRLASRADVLVQNFRPGVADRLGIGYTNLSQMNPRLVYCSVSGFGQDGPYRDRPGFDPLLQAMGGMMTAQGLAPGGTGDPIFIVFAVNDYGTALLAANGVLSALFVREKTGRGQHVDASLLNSAVALQPERFVKVDARPVGQGSVVPYQLFKARDAWFFLGVAHDGFWLKFCNLVLRDPELAKDPRFATNPKRVENKPALIEKLREILAQRDAAAWLEELVAAGVPCAPVQTTEQFMDDPQVVHNGMVVEREHAILGKMKTGGVGVKLSDLPFQPTGASPALGQHTREVLARFGFLEAEVEDLEREGVIYQRP
jgi:crotonobetainyl-CoA:carnitine CoA-transferase CaiB-like acyl-CoA transferase